MNRFFALLVAGVIIAGVALVVAPSMPAAQAATVYLVDDNLAQCPDAGYDNSVIGGKPLQTAIGDAINSGKAATILVCAGVYDAFTIDAATNLTVRAQDPATPPTIRTPAPIQDGTLVIVTDSTNVILDGLYVDGDQSFNHSPGGEMGGIYFGNSSGTIQNNVVYNVRDTVLGGASSGQSIIVTNATSAVKKVTVRNNLIVLYHNVGIWVIGAVKMTISENTIDGGEGATSGPRPPAAMQVSYSGQGLPSGSISKNVFHFNQTGILLYTGGLMISGNTFSSIGYGIDVIMRCDTLINGKGVSANKNRITGNSFFGQLAVRISPYAQNGGGVTLCDPHADGSMISKNTIVAEILTQPAAVLIDASGDAGTFTAHAENNVISGNSIWGYGQALLESNNAAGRNSASKNVVVHP